jgi:hypothetical protein
MATIDKNGKPGSARAPNGHSSHAPRRTFRIDRELPRRIEAQVKSNPAALMAAIGVGSFVLGALLGSRLGRVALAAAIPYAIGRVFEGVLGQKIADYARELTEEPGPEASA